MPVAIKESNKKISIEELANCEKVIGPLPADYRNFLLLHNGGKVAKNYYEVPGGKNTFEVRQFFGILGPNVESDLLHKREFYIKRTPGAIVPIAYAEGGNLVCLSTRPDSFGQVFFWDHELEASDGEEATWENLFKVADSFDEFFQNLHTPPERAHLKSSQATKVWIKPGFLESLKQRPKD